MKREDKKHAALTDAVFTAAIAIAFLALCFCVGGCGSPRETGRYNETISPGDQLSPYGYVEIDRGFDLLVARLEELGPDRFDNPRLYYENKPWGIEHLTRPGDLLRRASVDIKTHEVFVVRGKRYHGMLQNGGNGVTFEWSPGICLADTAMLWEATHAILTFAAMDNSRYDTDPIWQQVGKAMLDWRAEICPPQDQAPEIVPAPAARSVKP
jgi:hypothetical protein